MLILYEGLCIGELIDLGDSIADDEAFGTCGLVYETGAEDQNGLAVSHIHILSDVRITVSLEYIFCF